MNTSRRDTQSSHPVRNTEMITAFGLMVVTLLNGTTYESVPAVFDTEEECLAYEQTVTKDYYETKCFEGTFIETK